MQVTIKYYLSTDGQRASLLAGGDGKQAQTLLVGPDAADFAAVVAKAEFVNDVPVLDTQYQYPRGWHSGQEIPATKWDKIPTATEILADEVQRVVAWDAKHAEKQEAKRQQTLAALTERKTKENNKWIEVVKDGVTGRALVSYRYADWPYDRDEAVVDSPEAAAWIAELAAAENIAEEAAKIEAEKDADAKLAAKVAKDEAAALAAEKRAARRAERGCGENDIDITIENGALCSAPVWETHSRGKNWMAIIQVDPRSPGGLKRDFADKAKGDCYYMLPSLAVGDAVEFGGDYISGGGKKTENRWYGFVVKVEPTYLVLRKCAGGKSAVTAGAKFAAKQEKAAVS